MQASPVRVLVRVPAVLLPILLPAQALGKTVEADPHPQALLPVGETRVEFLALLAQPGSGGCLGSELPSLCFSPPTWESQALCGCLGKRKGS